MTSSMPPPRSDLGLDSPIAQRIASRRFDLPQPLGPTTPVSPGSIRRSAGSTKLLKPLSLRRLIRNGVPPTRSLSAAAGPPDLRLEILPGRSVGDLSVDHKGGRAVDTGVHRRLRDIKQPLEPLWIGKALPRPRRSYSEASRDLRELPDLREPHHALLVRQFCELRLVGIAELFEFLLPLRLGCVDQLGHWKERAGPGAVGEQADGDVGT